MKNVIIVAAHKPYDFPKESLYLPVQAGAACHDRLDMAGDDSGESISEKNGLYCELTALYWAWKNIPFDTLGLCHYRRYFEEPGKKEPLREETLEKLMGEAPVILPKKRNYRIETGESQFVHAHGEESLSILRDVLRELRPGYLSAFDRSMGRTSGHRFNMFIMKREQAEAYCDWLFEILFAVEKKMENPAPRMLGFLAERLMDAWIETTGTAYTELAVYSTEKTNWVKKGGAFLMRKFRGRKDGTK